MNLRTQPKLYYQIYIQNKSGNKKPILFSSQLTSRQLEIEFHVARTIYPPNQFRLVLVKMPPNVIH